jgi:hypothetical protein
MISIPIAWTACQLRWIHERHAFLEAHHGGNFFLCYDSRPAPWQLRVFGERGFEHSTFTIEEPYLDTAKELFPEVDTFHAVDPGKLY